MNKTPSAATSSSASPPSRLSTPHAVLSVESANFRNTIKKPVPARIEIESDEEDTKKKEESSAKRPKVEEKQNKKAVQKDPTDYAYERFLKNLGSYWDKLSQDLYASFNSNGRIVAQIYQTDFMGRPPFNPESGPYLYHDFVSNDYQLFLTEDVLRFERDSTVLVIGSDYTPGFIGIQLPAKPRPGATEAQHAEFIAEMRDVTATVRRNICAASQWRLSPNMFPLRESSVRCPFRAICFVVPAKAARGNGASTVQSNHFSMLIYYLEQASPQSDVKSMIRIHASRPVTKAPDELPDARAQRLDHLPNYQAPRLYHFDSIESEPNRHTAYLLAQNLCKVGLILDEVGEYNLISGVTPNPDSAGRDTHFQLQSSCGTWSLAYAEKSQDGILRRNYGRLPSSVIYRMNEVCTTQLVREVYNKLIRTGQIYHTIDTDSDFVIPDARVKEVARRLQAVVRFGPEGSTDELRLENLADYLANRVYFNHLHPRGQRKDKFVFDDDLNITSDTIRLYLAVDFAIPDDVLFAIGEAGLVNLSARWMSAIGPHISRSNLEAVSGPTQDRVLTGHYWRQVWGKMPRLVAWLQLPDQIENSADYPMLVVFRPLYRSTMDRENPGVVVNTTFVYTANALVDKQEVLNRFFMSVHSFMPKSTEMQDPDIAAFDDIIHVKLDAKMGRYFVMHLLRTIVTGDLDLPDTALKCNQLAQLVTEENPFDVSERSIFGQQNIPMGIESKSSNYMLYLSRRFRRQLYGRLLHVITGQEPLSVTPVNIDTHPFLYYSQIPIRENSKAVLGQELIRFKSRWEDRTRRIWASQYFNGTLRGALEAAIYQLTRTLDPLINAAFDQAEKQTAKKLGLRLTQSCPNCTKIWIDRPDPVKWELPFCANTGNEWVHVSLVQVPPFFRLWRPHFPEARIPRAPSTTNEYLSTPLKPLADMVYRVQGIDNPNKFYGMLQFPVILQGEATGMYMPAETPIDLWDILAIVCTDQFWQITEALIDGRERWQFTETVRQPPYSFDASARILHTDPYVRVVLRDYNLLTPALFLAELEQLRKAIPDQMTLRDVCEAGLVPVSAAVGKLHKIANFSFADVALLSVMALIRRASVSN